MEHYAGLIRFYDEAYSQDPARSAVYARWRGGSSPCTGRVCTCLSKPRIT
jgi:hypothetical protein